MSRQLQYLQFGNTAYATNMSWVGAWEEEEEKPIPQEVCPELKKLDHLDRQEAKARRQYRQGKIPSEQFYGALRAISYKRDQLVNKLEKTGYFPPLEEREPALMPWYKRELSSAGRVTAFIGLVVALAFTDLCFGELDSRPEEVICLAKNAFFEARGEGDLGKRAVTWVAVNRMNSGGKQWPTSPCKVVYQPSSDPSRPAACNFSWTCDSRPDAIPLYEEMAWTKSIIIAWEILNGHNHIDYFDPTFGATHYVRCGVTRDWLKNLSFKVKIGRHCFYG